MIEKLKTFIVKYIIAPAGLAVSLAGCASGGTPPLLAPITYQTNQVQQVQQITQTNVVVQTNVVTVTNGVTTTNTFSVTVPVLETNIVNKTNTVTVTNGYTVAPTVQTILNDASAANSLTAPFNPYSVLVTGVLGLVAGGLGFYAKVKTAQAQQHLSTASTIITAVEGLAPAVASGVKAAVQAQALKMGTTAAVQSTVQAVTANLPASTT